MLVAAAVCPCPPVLVPELAVGAAPELDGARAACADALAVLAAAHPDRIVVVGPGRKSEQGPYAQGTPGSFRGFGVDVGVRLGSVGAAGWAAAGRTLPSSLAVAAWLLQRAECVGAPVEGLAVAEDLAPERCAAQGAGLAARDERVALLVMGDASACRSVRAPGYLDERAPGFDAEVARALRSADVTALKALDPGLARELKASGRAPWQVLAGAAENTTLSGRLLYEEAPYGVGYLVATWA